MKKTIFKIIALCGLLSGLNAADNLKIKIEGPESSYNQLRIVNDTEYENFDCNAFLLTQKDGSFIVKRKLGAFHLKENGDTDSCKMTLKRNQTIGISLPEEFNNVDFCVDYLDLPFFDVVKVTLRSGDYTKAEEIEEGTEF